MQELRRKTSYSIALVGAGYPLRRLARLHASSPSAHSRLALASGHPAGLLLREHAAYEDTPRLPIGFWNSSRPTGSASAAATFHAHAELRSARSHALGESPCDEFSGKEGVGVLVGDVQRATRRPATERSEGA
jgi:hypothetical protein